MLRRVPSWRLAAVASTPLGNTSLRSFKAPKRGSLSVNYLIDLFKY